MTTAQEVSDQIDQLGKTALLLKAQRDELAEALKFVLADFTPENDFRLDVDTVAIVRAALEKAGV